MKPEVNNIDLILPLLKWEKTGDYFYLQIFLRKVDNTTTFGNKNNSARLIKAYCFFNQEQILAKTEEIIKLCNLYKARAGINLNIRNEEEVAYELLENLADRLKSKNYRGINGILNTTNGSVKSRDKYWLIDCDSEEEFNIVFEILNSETIRPEGNKIVAVLPSYKGKHVITKRFDRLTFNNLLVEKLGKTIDLHTNNPAAYFYPQQD